MLNIFKQQKDQLTAPELFAKLKEDQIPVIHKAGYSDLELFNPLPVPVRKGSVSCYFIVIKRTINYLIVLPLLTHSICWTNAFYFIIIAIFKSFSGINEIHGLKYTDKTNVVDEKDEIEYRKRKMSNNPKTKAWFI